MWCREGTSHQRSMPVLIPPKLKTPTAYNNSLRKAEVIVCGPSGRIPIKSSHPLGKAADKSCLRFKLMAVRVPSSLSMPLPIYHRTNRTETGFSKKNRTTMVQAREWTHKPLCHRHWPHPPPPSPDVNFRHDVESYSCIRFRNSHTRRYMFGVKCNCIP